jgi:hypothetical protein
MPRAAEGIAAGSRDARIVRVVVGWVTLEWEILPGPLSRWATTVLANAATMARFSRRALRSGNCLMT